MAKTATFGIMHIGTSFTVTYALTGSYTVAGAVTLVEPMANTVMHYFFDRHWDHPRVVAVRTRMARATRWVAMRRQDDAAVDHFSTKARSIT
jgi:uncharacterized membrane protein